MAFGYRSYRIALAGGLLLAAGPTLLGACVNRQPKAPRIDSIEPSSTVRGESVQVTIHGRFHLDVHVDYQDSSRSRLGTEFSARIGTIELDNVEYAESSHLLATVSADLEVGVYRLTVEDPAGRSAVLEAAFEVLPPDLHVVIEDAHSGLGTEIGDVELRLGQALMLSTVGRQADQSFAQNLEVAWSLSGDIGALDSGVGSQTLFTASTIGTGTISAEHDQYGNDETGVISVTSCTEDVECADPCRSVFACVAGACILGQVDKDEDGDSLIDIARPGGTDCDDGNANCTTDCTDEDSDSFCANHDCDDAPDSCGAGCFPNNPALDMCDGFDQDCDNDTDEDHVPDSGCFRPGVCAAGNVASSCTGGVETACATGPESGISETICDGNDDDCDALIDEDGVCEHWWDSQWGNRTKITFDNRASVEDLIDFPVLVSLNTTNLPSLDLNTVVGADIRFRDAITNAELNYEVEAWDADADTATVWVKVPQLDGSSDTDFIWVYYSYDGLATYDQSATNEQAIWDDNFKGVWHLEESVIDEQTDGTHDDSTGVNDGMQRNNAAGTGKIAGGQHFDGTDHINIGAVADDIDVTAGTFSAWVQLDPMNSLGVILSTYPAGDQFIEIRWWDPNDEVSHKYRVPSAHTDVVDSAYDETSDIWHHATMTWDTTGSELKAYTDGVQVGTTLGMAGPIVIGLSVVTIGARVGNAYGIVGDIDEVRISDTARSADWIKASFLSQNGTFNTFGSEEAAP